MSAALQVWKYPLLVTRDQTIMVPWRTDGLSVQLQGGVPTLWALTAVGGPLVERSVVTVGTGHKFSFNNRAHKFVDTYQLPDGTVWHVFMAEPDVG